MMKIEFRSLTTASFCVSGLFPKAFINKRQLSSSAVSKCQQQLLF